MHAILRKSAAGQEALQSRDTGSRLSARLRTVLLQVDGQKTFEQLDTLAQSLGNPADTMARLLELGLVEVVPGSEVSATATEAESVNAGEAESAEAATSPRSIAAAALAEVASRPAAPEARPETDAGADDSSTELPVSARLPEALRPVAAQMRKLAEQQLGLSALLLKRRISKCDTEAELRLALVALRDALAKAGSNEQADALLHEVYQHLPMIGLQLARAF